MIIDGQPVPWHRAQHAGKRSYQHPLDREYQSIVGMVAQMAVAHRKQWRKDGEYSIAIFAYRSDKRRCDVDNIAKNVMDALTKIVYADDAQVTSIAVTRAIDKQRPRIEIAISAAPIDAAAATIEAMKDAQQDAAKSWAWTRLPRGPG